MTRHHSGDDQMERIPTGITGFDFITHGGLPERRLTLLALPDRSLPTS